MADMAKPVSATDALTDFRVSAKRAPMYNASARAKRALVPAVGESAYVTRAAHVKSGVPVLLVQDGSTQSALPLSAIGAAIASGVITSAEILALTT